MDFLEIANATTNLDEEMREKRSAWARDLYSRKL